MKIIVFYLVFTLIVKFSFAQTNLISLDFNPISYINAKPLTKFNAINSDEIFRVYSSISYSIGYTYTHKKKAIGIFYESTEKIIKAFPNVNNQYYLANVNSLSIKNGRVFKLSDVEFIPLLGLKFSFYNENIYDRNINNRQKWLSNSVSINILFRYKSQYQGKPKYLQKIYVLGGFGLEYEAFYIKLKNIKYDIPLFLNYGVNFGIGYSF